MKTLFFNCKECKQKIIISVEHGGLEQLSCSSCPSCGSTDIKESEKKEFKGLIYGLLDYLSLLRKGLE